MLVYKYRGGAFDRDLKSLTEDYFWSAAFDSLNDRCEAMFINNIPNELDTILSVFRLVAPSIDKNVEQQLLNQIEIFAALRSKLGIFSLSNNFSHPLLWAHYANADKGFCIEYDSDLLQKKLNSYGKHYLINVKYSDKPDALGVNHLLNLKSKPFDLLQTMFGTKPSAWGYEEETRLITDLFGEQHYDYRAVKAIYFGTRMPKEEKNEIMKSLQGRGIKYYQMHAVTGSYNITATPEQDPYLNAPQYRYSVAPVQEGASDAFGIRKEFQPYIPYLQKAVEIQRREPYCEEVCYASFSIDRSTPNAPVIFVQYKYSPDGYMNNYYSLPEIDAKHSTIKDL